MPNNGNADAYNLSHLESILQLYAAPAFKCNRWFLT